VVVEAAALAPLGHDGQLRLGGVAHEQQDVHVTRFPVGEGGSNDMEREGGRERDREREEDTHTHTDTFTN
jgi:hypothetical protein